MLSVYIQTLSRLKVIVFALVSTQSSFSQAELSSQRFTKPLDRLGNLVGRGSGKRRSEEHLFFLRGSISLEPASTRHQDALVNRGFEDRLLDRVVLPTLLEARVFAPVDLDPVLQIGSICQHYGLPTVIRIEKVELTNMPAEGGTQLAISVGKNSSHARTMTSLRCVYSSRRCTSQSRYPACPHCSSSSLYRTSWEIPLGF